MKYYKTDSRRISFREYWHLSRKGFLLGWINKIRGVRMNLAAGFPEPQPFRDKIMERDQVPPPVLETLAGPMAELRQLGCEQFWFYRLKESLMPIFSYGVETLHPGQK